MCANTTGIYMESIYVENKCIQKLWDISSFSQQFRLRTFYKKIELPTSYNDQLKVSFDRINFIFFINEKA